MKKVWTILLVLVLILCLSACNQTESIIAKEFVFPEDTCAAGMDISGLTKESAWSKLEDAVSSYALDLTVDGNPVHITGKDIGLTCSQENFMAGADALEAGEAADFSQVVRFNDGKLRILLGRKLSRNVQDAAIVYDEAAGQFILEPHAEGLKVDRDALAVSLKETIRTLRPEKTVTGFAEVLLPTWSADAPDAQAVLEQVNKMLSVKLAYEFSTSSTGKAHEIPAETIVSFVDLGADGFTPSVKQDVLDAYVNELSDKYSISSISGPFQTTGGSTVNLTIYYDGLYVDTAGLAQDIAACMFDGISGTRTAPYLDSGIRDLAYGGTYIEINLNTQHLWFYKKGELLVSTPFVSGCVAENNHTPTGVYAIYSKSADLYLVGPTWRDWVSYWMPFYGGYGLHDATWRDEFGGDIYLYEGSHGCVNLPLDAAGIIYKNAPVGTKVILYGGKSSVPDLPQELTGTTSYDVANDAKTFKLDITPKFEKPKLTYTSDNTDVATVDSTGKVTVKGIGTTKITVTAAEVSYYTDAKITVTVNVHSACDEGRHAMGEAVVVEKPTCQKGRKEQVCTKCGYKEETVLEPVKEHTFSDWTTVLEPTCNEAGSKERICTRCEKEKETESIPATGEHQSGDWQVVREATCAKKGKEAILCTVCNKELETRSIPKSSHQYEDGPVCTVCGAENPDYDTASAE